jgi:hypothetical protein
MILNFGKYKGCYISKIDESYLLFLAGEDVWDDNARNWIKRNHPEAISAAKNLLKERRKANIGICKACGGKLVPIGYARANGANHADWKTRLYHKKCYLNG